MLADAVHIPEVRYRHILLAALSVTSELFVISRT